MVRMGTCNRGTRCSFSILIHLSYTCKVQSTDLISDFKEAAFFKCTAASSGIVDL